MQKSTKRLTCISFSFSQLPWYFPPGEGQSTFPKASVPRRRRRRVRRTPNVAVDLPESKERSHMASNVDVAASGLQPITVSSLEKVQESLATPEKSAEGAPSESSTIAARSEPETPATSHPPSETDYLGGGGAGGATAAGNAAAASPETPKPFHSQPQQHQQTRRDTRSAIAVPNISGLPKNNNNKPVDATTLTSPPPGTAAVSSSENDRTPKAEDQISVATGESAAAAPDAASQASSQPAPVPVAKSWADLVRRNAKPTAAAAAGATGVSTLSNGEALTNGFHAGGAASKTASLGDALKQYSVQHDTTLSFLEPRGLVNTGNMCYMNSVSSFPSFSESRVLAMLIKSIPQILQVLVFCAPFYSFLDHVRHRTVHSLSQRASRTPLIDAMILFMREFKVLAHAESPDALRKVLRAEQLEVYGEPVTPEYVYDVIRTLPTFAHMRRGHQQDAEEFLGFLLEGLHDECAGVMAQGQTSGEPVAESADASSAPADPSESNTTTTTVDGWQEVGPKQKSALTRTAGTPDPPSPITKIFGGHLRSELRVPGLQTSAVYEPFKPLQLDIGAPDVHNIVDALRGLTRIESLDGSFGGRTNATAKKQVFIHDLPEVLILHLKRFQYDLTGTQKIWKKVGYPLELEIPKEVFAPAERKSLALKGGMPRYRLIGVVYHHGKSAAGGHYTVDVRRQDGREWVRMDDTFIRRVRAEEVAAAGAEEEGAKVTTTTAGSKSHDEIAAAAVRASQPTQTQRNMYHGLDDAEDEEDGADDDDASGERRRPWEEVNGTARPTSASAAAATTNGTSPASTTLPNGHNHNHKSAAPLPLRKENVRDNKVAYILLYERMRV